MAVQRFFRSDDATYEAIRIQLDAVWGHGPGAGALTCYEPAATAPHDSQGRVLLAVHPEFCEYEAVAAMLPQLLASGAVEEIDEATYRSSLPAVPSPVSSPTLSPTAAPSGGGTLAPGVAPSLGGALRR